VRGSSSASAKALAVHSSQFLVHSCGACSISVLTVNFELRTAN
jgi:hypothetical protein